MIDIYGTLGPSCSNVKTLEEMNPQYPEMPEEEKAKIGEYREALNNE